MSKIVVRGRGPFPLDMLRFSEAWPADSESVARIHNSIGREVINERGPVGDITLYTGRKREILHLLQRWESFGWHAYVVDSGIVVMSTDLKQSPGAELRANPVGSRRTQPDTPADLASAHYRIGFAGADCRSESLRGRYWWTKCESGQLSDTVMSSREWDTVGEAIDAARLDMQEHAEERERAHPHAGNGEPDPCDDLPRHQGTRQRFDQGR